MNNLIIQPNNLFSKFWIWIKKKLFKKRANQLNDISNNNNGEKAFREISKSEINLKQSQKQEKRYVYVQDLDFEQEKKYTIELLMDVLNDKKRIEDLDLADKVRIKILLDG